MLSCLVGCLFCRVTVSPCWDVCVVGVSEQGKTLVELSTAFGSAVEGLVIKHGKGIVEEQLQLSR